MAIPAADPVSSIGELPPGEHLATWAEILTRFGKTPHRRRLLAGLEEAIRILRAGGASSLYLDGSFVTGKESSNDFDACYDIDAATLQRSARQEPVFLDLMYPRSAMKARFRGELFPSWFIAAGSIHSPIEYRTFFQQNRYGMPKGVVVIDLGRWP